ncbi:MAG: hypothetical protein QM765_44155 [Myxococcales bacterium]
MSKHVPNGAAFAAALALAAWAPGCSKSSTPPDGGAPPPDASSPRVCGNNTIEGDEKCDGTNSNGKSCTTEGFSGGTLGCYANCSLDLSGCTAPATCANGAIDNAEQCDGTNLNGKSCQSLGFATGTLTCNANCSLNPSTCFPAKPCGNGAIDPGEACDGTKLNNKSCTTEGFSGGALACNDNCSLDLSGCTAPATCSNGAVDGAEQCDGVNLNSKTCQSLGFASGTLTCNANCSFNTSVCANASSCGNGALDSGEGCDGANLNSKTCTTEGFVGGTLACGSTCQLDTSGCQQATPCTYDDDCGPSERCSETLTCVPAIPCNTPANCTPSDDNDQARAYCENATVGLGCRCVTSPAADGGTATGYCKRRLPPCAPCQSDEQCGTDPLFFRTPLHEPGKCVALDGVKVCLEPFVSAKCACGESANLEGGYYCTPQGASCGEDGAFLCCQKDGNCPPEHPLCETATGRCQDVCWYDFDKKETIGCRADKVCHVNPKFLTPTSPNFGAGRCGPPCAADTDCAYLRDDFVCRAETGSDKRCRPPGCLGDIECPEQPPESPSTGYCERTTGACMTDCRTGKDPVTSVDYADCKGGYKCQKPSPSAPGTCVEQTCVEQGGAQQFCRWNEMCCGEDRDGDTTTDPEPCTDATGNVIGEPGKCYRMPNPPWCAECDPNDVKSCTGKPGYPTSTKDPNVCFPFGPGSDGVDRGNACAFACAKDTECPKGFFCKDVEVYCTPDTAAQDCGDANACQDTGQKDGQGNPIYWCRCTTAGSQAECPMELDPNVSGGPHARCSDDAYPSNRPWLHCIWTHACVPYVRACMPPPTSP